MPKYTIDVPAFNASSGLRAPDLEGGEVTIESDLGDTILISGDAAGLRDLASLLFTLAEEPVPHGYHFHLDPGVLPLAPASRTLIIQRDNPAHM